MDRKNYMDSWIKRKKAYEKNDVLKNIYKNIWIFEWIEKQL